MDQKTEDAINELRAVIDDSEVLTEQGKAKAREALASITAALPDDEDESPILRALNDNPTAVLAALSGLGSYLNNREERANFGAKMAERHMGLLERIVARVLDLPPSPLSGLFQRDVPYTQSWDSASAGWKTYTGGSRHSCAEERCAPIKTTPEQHRDLIRRYAEEFGIAVTFPDDPAPDADKPAEG